MKLRFDKYGIAVPEVTMRAEKRPVRIFCLSLLSPVRLFFTMDAGSIAAAK